MNKNVFAGFDIGGNYTKICVINEKNEKILSKKDKGLNFSQISPENVVNFISFEIEKLKEYFEPTNYHLQSATFGVSGISSHLENHSWQKKLEKKFRLKFQFMTDAELAFRSAFDEEKGVLIILGTGGVIFGKNEYFFQKGGFGYFFNEWNGAASVGLNLLRYYQKIIDKDISDPDFFSDFSKEFPELNGNSLKRIYQNDNLPRYFSTFSSFIGKFYQKHLICKKIINKLKTDLVDQLQTIVKNENIEEIPLLVTGGFYQNNKNLFENFSQMIPKNYTFIEKEIFPEKKAAFLAKEDFHG
jgi:N-acetylglucosamine kinase-like BadF-type ATPase